MHVPNMSRYYNVGLDENGQPIQEDVAQAVKERVFIKSRLT
jgi:hypothetical protein